MNASLERLKSRVEQFRENLRDYKNKNYDEYNTRADFIDTLFAALGWDMYNEQKIIEQFREVVREDRVEIDGMKKKPDYSFRVGPHVMFYVEAKKPSVDIKNDPAPALQLRRYAHTQGLALSILTDFEEIAVYDTRIKPSEKDSASVARVFYCTIDELFGPYKTSDYDTNFDFLSGIFSKQSVLTGSFTAYAEKNKKGTMSVDRGFLSLLDSWRSKLAESIALKNDSIDEFNLNIAVQKIIDRLVFLRIAEDRQIEAPDLLLEAAGKTGVYDALNNIFAKADIRYNARLFASENWMIALTIEDRALKEIIAGMYAPQCDYEFQVLPIEILGNAYEQFLGKTITFTRKTKFGHAIEIEEKPEVRKAGGVYYTPDYIVDYIVENTVGRKIRDRTPEEIEAIKIVDPACGSGSFLIGAFDYLLRYHLEYYLKDATRIKKAMSAGIIYQAGEGRYRLSTKTKSKILVNNIYGVDIDTQAVEVTRLSLLLKVLEDENLEYREQLFKAHDEHILPDLSANIKCGNSLISGDYYDDKDMKLFGPAEMRAVNAFDWRKEFKDVFKNDLARAANNVTSPPDLVMKDKDLTSPPALLQCGEGRSGGGFDCVIGNPPYVRQELLSESKGYFQNHYTTFQGTADLYVAFIEKGYSLLKDDGLFSYIVANKWMRANYAKSLREWMKQKHIEEIIDFGDLPVFQQATTYPCIIRLRKAHPAESFLAVNMDSLNFTSLNDHVRNKRFQVIQSRLSPEGWQLANTAELDLLEKIKSKGVPLEQYVEGKIYYGIKTGLNEAFVIDAETRDRLIAEDSKSAEVIKPFLAGRDIKRYAPLLPDKYLILIPKGWTKEKGGNDRTAWKILSDKYPAIAQHLKVHEEKCEKRYDKGDYWWELRACEYYDEFENIKIIYPNILSKPEFTYDEQQLYTNQKCFIIPTNDKYFLGILNSNITFFLFRKILPKLRGDFYEPSYIYFKLFPIKTIDSLNINEKGIHDKIVNLVDSMLASQKQLASAKSDSDRSLIQQKIDALDRQIDKLVYELYGLTEEEIHLVEEGE